jgi:hypothetical protein
MQADNADDSPIKQDRKTTINSRKREDWTDDDQVVY